MKRAFAFAVTLTLAAGCSGGGGNLLPGSLGYSPSNALRGGADNLDAGRHELGVRVTMRIPRHRRHDRLEVHPATISPLTKSVSISVNGGAASIFNATPSSPNCSIGAGGTTCTFVVKAPPGSDSFVITTYGSTGGLGTPLNRGTAIVPIVAGKANAPHIKLGPVVSTTADSGAGSLRYAIGSANPGDTILFLIPVTSTIKVNSPLTLNSSVSIAGPGVTTSIRVHHSRRHPQLHSNVSYGGIVIDGQGTQQIFVIKAGVTATISGLVLTNGNATTTNQPGGAVYSEGVLTLAKDVLTENDSQVSSPYIRIHHAERASRKTHRASKARPGGLHPHVCAYYYGGAVYNHGNLIVTGSTFDSNVLDTVWGCGSYGGAIYNDEYGTLTSSGNTYTRNGAYYGGAVYNNSTYGQASFTSDKFTSNVGCTTSTGCALSGCAGSGCTTYPYGEGGAIYDGDGPGITVTGSTFSNNTVGGIVGASGGSAGYGGALYLASGSPSVTSSMFSNNLAGGGVANCSGGYGGAIYEDAGNALVLNNDTFTGNKAGGDDYGYGGGVYNHAQADSGSGNTFTSNQAFATGSPCKTTGEAAGGAIYAGSGITMSGSKFSSNLAKANYDAWAGAIYEDEASLLTSDTFTSNNATGTGLASASASYAYGGAIYFDAALRLNTSTFTSNSAIAQSSVGSVAEGGAIYSSDTLTSNGNSFTSNSVSNAGTSPTAEGGAVFAASTLVSNGDKFASNSGSGKSGVSGGAVYIDSTFGLSNGTFTSNKVTATAGESYGGAVTVDSTGTLSNTTFTGNSSSSTGYSNAYGQGGGAIYDDGPATLNDIKVSGNTVTGGSGGGIYVESSTELLNGSTISGNSASSAGDYGGGGGIYNYDGMSISNSTLSGNTAAVSGNYSGGGGLYIDDTTAIYGSTISGNKVTGSGTLVGGGGIFDYYYTLNAMNSTISNNSGANGGGIVFYDNPSALLQNVTIFQNSATVSGGGIYNDSGSMSTTLANTIVGGGSAPSVAAGKDVYNAGTIASSGYNILQTGQAGGGTFTFTTGDEVANPLLLGLSNNGGPTFTNADQATSPGKAHIPWTSASGGTCGNVGGMAVDQRNFSRGAGGKCDSGAYEFAGSPSAIRSRPPAVRPDRRKHHAHRHVRHVPPHER